MLKEKYRRFKVWQQNAFNWSFDKNELHRCVNCGNDFAGNFCPNCSQKANWDKISWKSVIQSTAEVWGLHNRSMPYSLWQLLFRPGYFISDYINGKRQVSFPPVKMLIIMGIISIVVDYLFKTPDITQKTAISIEEGSPLVAQYFAWIDRNPGWGWLSLTCFFLLPTWSIFRYAPRNAKHSLPQGFFIQVFMSIQVLIVDDLADFFTQYFYILFPLCYLYAYRQLFGYRFWGNLWRGLLMLVSGYALAVLVMSLYQLLSMRLEKSYESEFVTLGVSLSLSVGSMLAGLYISKALSKHAEKKKKEQLAESND